MLDRIENILAKLDTSNAPETMDLPGFRLHPLKGDLRGFWAVTVRANWRIVWRFEDEDAVDVDLIDYHQEDPAMPMKTPRIRAGSCGRSALTPWA